MKRSITPTIKKSYFLYFGCKVEDQDKKWAPHVCCTTCSSKLNAWVNGKRTLYAVWSARGLEGA